MSMVPKHVAVWLQSVVAAAPRDVRLVYIEWNDGRRGSERVLWFSAFGYTVGDFDPEDASSLSALSEWDWEAAESCAASPELASDDEALRRSIEELFAADRSILDPLIKRRGQIAFGRHESCVAVFPRLDRPQASSCYYELYVASQSNHVETSGFDEFDSTELTRVIEHRRFERPFPPDATFHLQPRGKERDVLRAVRYFVCSDRMRELIESATDQCQVFPINLYRSKKVDENKRVPGYYVVNLHEQLECLDPATVLPPPYEGFLPTFDPVRGYRIVSAKVGKRDIFRIAYEHRRLLVSHAFRMKCERAGITGVEWLRRQSV
jgi:hypothetical protein